MRKRAPVHPFDVALGLVWLTIIFIGILYLLTRERQVAVPVLPASPIEFDEKLQALSNLQGGAVIPAEDERLRTLRELADSTVSDDRASVYPGSESDASMSDKLRTLEALRVAR